LEEALQNQQSLYDRSWETTLAAGREQRSNLQTNLDFLRETALLKAGDRILEIGCGIGTVVHELSRQGYDIRGTDIANAAIEYGLKKYGDIKLAVQPAEELPYEDRSFDVVLSFDLFEHIARIDRHVAEVSRVLKPGGYYLFQTPNKFSNIIHETLHHRSLAWRRFHPSLHTPGQVRRRLGRHGFSVQFRKMNIINAFTLKKLAKYGLFGTFIGKIDFTRLPLGLQTNLYVIAQRKEGAGA
jgi:2-polyprenyl-3-methyl-5-hydroxy-6-metoxy-1,4-benzoquinol methylase